MPDPESVLWEFLLEEVRLQKFPELPSRLKSVFLFPEANQVEVYRTHILRGRWKGVLYRCSVEGDEYFTTDMNLVVPSDWKSREFTSFDERFATIKSLAFSYWQEGNPNSVFYFPEIISASPVRVIGDATS